MTLIRLRSITAVRRNVVVGRVVTSNNTGRMPRVLSRWTSNNDQVTTTSSSSSSSLVRYRFYHNHNHNHSNCYYIDYQQHNKWITGSNRSLSSSSSSAAVAAFSPDDHDDDHDDDDVTPTTTTTASSSSSSSLLPPPLMELRQVRLKYPPPPNLPSSSSTLDVLDDSTTSTTITKPFTVSILPPSTGGHAILGKNGIGKTLVTQAIAAHNFQRRRRPNQQQQQQEEEEEEEEINPFVQDGIFDINTSDYGKWHSKSIVHVSFASHQELLQQSYNSATTTIGCTVRKAISNATGIGNLSKAAQFLIVRFGLYPLLNRDVTTLSTGEIRKVLLVCALSNRPRILLLDNAFDGLDVVSRDTLKELVSTTITGFKQDILVQGVTSKATSHTQIILITHRAEEIVSEIETISIFPTTTNDDTTTKRSEIGTAAAAAVNNDDNNNGLQTFQRQGRTGLELLQLALVGGRGGGGDDGCNNTKSLMTLDWDNPQLPSRRIVQEWWEQQKEGRQQQLQSDRSSSNASSSSIMVHAQNLTINRGGITLLHNLNWTVKKGQRWLVAGGNGAGKSTLSRLLARPNEETIDILLGYTNSFSSKKWDPTSSANKDTTAKEKDDEPVLIRDGVGYVSTEYHMQMADSMQLTRDILQQKEVSSSSSSSSTQQENEISAETVIKWLGIDDNEDLLSRPFYQLSQGQQKMILIAAAISCRPPLLVLDEPCQGLDLENRQRLLTTMERICHVTDMSLVYITHHFEEVLPSMTHVLHLKDRQDVFNGTIDEYDPEVVSQQS